MKLKDEYSKEALKKILIRVTELLETEKGFLIIVTKENKKITDLYHNVSKEDVLKCVEKTTNDYEKTGLFNEVKKQKW